MALAWYPRIKAPSLGNFFRVRMVLWEGSWVLSPFQTLATMQRQPIQGCSRGPRYTREALNPKQAKLLERAQRPGSGVIGWGMRTLEVSEPLPLQTKIAGS